jgi:hypothetical protein
VAFYRASAWYSDAVARVVFCEALNGVASASGYGKDITMNGIQALNPSACAVGACLPACSRRAPRNGKTLW